MRQSLDQCYLIDSDRLMLSNVNGTMTTIKDWLHRTNHDIRPAMETFSPTIEDKWMSTAVRQD